MLGLVRRARRRLFYNELFAQGANASSAALLAFILLLLLGTEILAWQVAVLLPLGAVVAGLYIARRRLASSYATAQKIDRRLGLADALSTAFYFSEPGHAAKATPEIVRAHAGVAEQIAATVDVRQAIPFRVPRTAYAMAALFIVAGSLFALRYGISRRLDLKQPLASMLHQTFGTDPVQQAKAKARKLPKPDYAPDADMASAEQREQRAGDPMEGPEQSEINEAIPGKMDSKSIEGAKKSQDGGEQSSASDQEASAEDRAGDEGESDGAGQQSDKGGKEGNSKQDSPNSGDNNSLMSKVKDAVQNLLSRVKPQQNQSGGQQQSGEQQGEKQSKGQQQGKQQSAKDGQKQDGSQQSDGQEGQQGEQSQNAQDQQGKGTGNSDSKQASKQPGSGVGSQDGEKRLKAAEQLAAMGKISEIIGKRSQTISGETTVEVQNTNQTLRTQYSKQAVQHTQTGSEIGRDEIPVALQSYVEQYFEAVRKAAPKK